MRHLVLLLQTLVLCFSLAAPVAASTPGFAESVISQLEEQGFVEFEVSRTLLGRIRIVAYSDELRREIVINPVTGEILRDYWRAITDDDRSEIASMPRLVKPGSTVTGTVSGSSSGSGSSSDDDHEEDDHEEDDHEEDEPDEVDEPEEDDHSDDD